MSELLFTPPVLQSTLFCQSVHWDVHGRLTITNTFFTLRRGEAQEFLMVNLWRWDQPEARDLRETVQLRDPDGHLLGEVVTAPFRLGGDVPRHLNYIRFHESRLITVGTHEVHVTLLDTADGSALVTSTCPLPVG